ncbi:MAG: cupin domain-containing protein [Candidatus Margulisiibacteriota bacterium]|jgi:quercetin dioxygenase-like cupin family protein
MPSFINRTMDLAREIDYAEGSIISKIIYKTDHTILTLFSLAEGQSIAEHVTPFEAMVQMLDGEAEIVIGGEQRTFKTGDSIIMPANLPHALYARKAFKMLLVMMKP